LLLPVLVAGAGSDRALDGAGRAGLGGVGRYLFGRMLPLICCDPVVVAVQPFPLDVARDEEGNADKESLKKGLVQIRRTWRSIGFQAYMNDIWVMDPNSSKHERALAG
jgi:hypothetical protein